MGLTHLKHILATKGLFHAVERTGQIACRFTFGRRRFRQMLAHLETEFHRFQVPMTFCVSAGVLSRNLDLIERLRNLGHEIASHGLHHLPLSHRSRGEQERFISESYRIFQQAGISVQGFRCPYLNYNQDTIELLQSSPFSWTSQHMIYWSNHFEGSIRRLFSLYQATSAQEAISVPQWADSILEIPISLPDDEMLVERLRARSPEQISEAWLQLSRTTHETGELLHLLFHPERFCYVQKALSEVIGRAREESPAVWIVSLSELSCWWNARSRAQWNPLPSENGFGLVALDAPVGACVLLKAVQAPDTRPPIFRDYYPVQPAACNKEKQLFSSGGKRRFSIGVSARCPRWLAAFLREEGFWVEESESPGCHSLYFGAETAFKENEKRAVLNMVDASPAPLLRLWRWPGAHRSALVISSDIDAVSLIDFWDRTRNFE